MAGSPLQVQRKSCYLAEGIKETTVLVAVEPDHDLLVYTLLWCTNQSRDPGQTTWKTTNMIFFSGHQGASTSSIFNLLPLGHHAE